MITSPMSPTRMTRRSMPILMTRSRFTRPPAATSCPFPLDQRFVIAGWKLLFLRRGSYQPDTTKARNGIAAPIWSKGWRIAAPATPRAMLLGAERASAPVCRRRRRQLAGLCDQRAVAVAGALGRGSACSAYLREGWHPDHGTARGPMAEVVSNLSSVTESDVSAIATYMAGVFGAPTPDRKRQGEEVLAQAKSPPRSSACRSQAMPPAHRSTPRPARHAMRAAGRCPMAASISGSRTAISAPIRATSPISCCRAFAPVEGERSPIMPGFAASMNDAQIAALLNYLRARFSNQPAWTGVEKTVEDARRTQTVFLQTSPGAAPTRPPIPAAKQRDKP